MSVAVVVVVAAAVDDDAVVVASGSGWVTARFQVVRENVHFEPSWAVT